MELHPIGTKFLPMRKHAVITTVIDILTTLNSAGIEVKKEYLCEHQFLGQRVTSIVVAATIARGIQNMHEKKAA